MSNKHIKIQSWIDAQDEIRKINPSLADAIESSGLEATCDFIRASYDYGELIIREGELQIPLSKNKTTSIADTTSLHSSIRTRLNNPNPIGILLNKSAESFYEPQTSSIPTKVLSNQILQPGDFIGLTDFLDSIDSKNKIIPDRQNISSGARSLFMLPRLTDRNSHYKLQNYFKIDVHRPNNIWEHYSIFKEIANSSVTEEKWYSDVLFFSNSWWAKKNQANAQPIKQVLLQQAWQQSVNSRKAMSLKLAWNLFLNSNDSGFKQSKLTILQTIEHLLAIQQGIYPGYVPTINNDVGPIDFIKKAYTDTYKIKSYPTIMAPMHITKTSGPVYYSLHIPALANSKSRGIYEKSTPLDFRELVALMDTLTFPLYPKDKFTFFQQEEYPALQINALQELINSDERFLPNKAGPQSLNISYSNPFLKSCIKIQS